MVKVKSKTSTNAWTKTKSVFDHTIGLKGLTYPFSTEARTNYPRLSKVISTVEVLIPVTIIAGAVAWGAGLFDKSKHHASDNSGSPGEIVDTYSDLGDIINNTFNGSYEQLNSTMSNITSLNETFAQVNEMYDQFQADKLNRDAKAGLFENNSAAIPQTAEMKSRADRAMDNGSTAINGSDPIAILAAYEELDQVDDDFSKAIGATEQANNAYDRWNNSKSNATSTYGNLSKVSVDPKLETYESASALKKAFENILANISIHADPNNETIKEFKDALANASETLDVILEKLEGNNSAAKLAEIQKELSRIENSTFAKKAVDDLSAYQSNVKDLKDRLIIKYGELKEGDTIINPIDNGTGIDNEIADITAPTLNNDVMMQYAGGYLTLKALAIDDKTSPANLSYRATFKIDDNTFTVPFADGQLNMEMAGLEGKTIELTNLTVTDEAGNEAYLGAPIQYKVPAKEVVTPTDTTTPEISNVVLKYYTEGKYIELNVSASDDKTSSDNLIASATFKVGDKTYTKDFLGRQLQLPIEENLEGKLIQLTNLTVKDAAGNKAYLGASVQYQVPTSEDPEIKDTVAPVIQNVYAMYDAESKAINLEVLANDNVDSVGNLTFRAEIAVNGSIYNVTLANGSYILPTERDWAGKNVTINKVIVTDKAGNAAVYNTPINAFTEWIRKNFEITSNAQAKYVWDHLDEAGKNVFNIEKYLNNGGIADEDGEMNITEENPIAFTYDGPDFADMHSFVLDPTGTPTPFNPQNMVASLADEICRYSKEFESG